jgi:NAD(P)-dependent dehydrogenase (short-subunit alcohol dehydrogenase family)
MIPLAHKTILVTGATGALGQALCQALAQEGAVLVLAGRNQEKLAALYDRLKAIGPEPWILPLDLQKTDEIPYLVRSIATEIGSLYGLVHLASPAYVPTPLHLRTYKDWQASLNVHLSGPFVLTSACLSIMAQAKEGVIVFTSATAGHEPHAFWGDFAISKAGVEAMAKILAEEWQNQGVDVRVVIPGPIDSAQRRKTHPGETQVERIPLKVAASRYVELLQKKRHEFVVDLTKI